MNCNNFEAIISDLAREQMMETHARESALSHMEECASCARLLEQERALTGSLRQLAASMEQCVAPASLEANLLVKFRERAITAQSLPVVIQMPQRAKAWRRLIPHAVAAAVLFMFAIGGASLLRLKEGKTISQPDNAIAGSSNKTVIPATPASTSPIQSVERADEVDGTTAVASGGDGGRGTERGQKLSTSEVAAIMGTTPARRGNYQAVPKPSINESRKTSTSAEIATDFMPVSYGDNLNEIDNGRIVRVEMPRSALAQFGLPVNMERANERIKADVLLGDDGMPRAIRFVR
jgi:hypothetical protein